MGRIERIGNEAERHFLAMIGGDFECHPPSKDQRGWDYIVEFPENQSARLQSDEFFHRDVEHRALIQVKGSRAS